MTLSHTDDRTVAEAFDTAILRLRTGGWHQGSDAPERPGVQVKGLLLVEAVEVLQRHPDLPVCGTWAVLYGCHGDLDLYEACCCLLADLVPQDAADEYRLPMPMWEDLPGRTVDEVVALLVEARDAATVPA